LEPGIWLLHKAGVLLAITDPNGARLCLRAGSGKIHEGGRRVAVDSFPNRRFNAWVGFISPVAEFTPKTVQTEELRTSLVYEVRVFVKDPADELRLGMPATVYLNTDKNIDKEKGRQGDRETG
jgi:HlyD family secretion protein